MDNNSFIAVPNVCASEFSSVQPAAINASRLDRKESFKLSPETGFVP